MQHLNHPIFNHTGLAIIILFLMSGVSCTISKPSQKIADRQAREIIERSIQFHGGMKIYDQLDYFAFEKVFALYEADGSVEYKRSQIHEYFPSTTTYHVRWEEAYEAFKNSQHGDQFSQEINGTKNTTIDPSKIKTSIYASVFTIFLPWKILDVGADISYEGGMTLEDGNEVYVVKAVYNPTQHQNHTKADIWWHYFDKENYQHIGYKVTLIDHTSLISNLDFQTVDGFTFPKTRKSWRVNAANEKEYLRAEYDYKILKIK